MFLDGQRQPAKFAEKHQPEAAKVEIPSRSLDAAVRPDRRILASSLQFPISRRGDAQRRRRARHGPNGQVGRPIASLVATVRLSPVERLADGPDGYAFRPPPLAQAVSKLESGRIKTGRDPLTNVKSPIRQFRFLQIVLLIVQSVSRPPTA